MATKVIKNLKIDWTWTGDDYAIKGFNVAVTPEGETPNTKTVVMAKTTQDAVTYTFQNITLDSGVNYIAWVQALYEGKDSDWLSTSNVSVSDDGSATITVKNSLDQSIWTTNTNFFNWTGSYPDGYSQWGSYPAPTKDTTNTKTGGKSVRYTVSANGDNRGMTISSSAFISNVPNEQYVYVELDFMLISGGITGAGVLVDWNGLTPYRSVVKISDYVSTPTLGKWHTVRTVVQRPSGTTGTFSQMLGYLMANYSECGTMIAKDIVFDRLLMRQATQQEIDLFANKNTWNTVATNFNNRNDRKSTTPANPALATDGTAIDHVLTSGDLSADISFEWTFTGSGDAYDIDGFNVYVYSSTSSSAYTFGTTPASEQVYVVPYDKRAFILSGVASNLYYTFGIQAYRVVDDDVNANGIICSSIVKSTATGENPYQPTTNTAFTGNISGTINGTAVATVVTNASNGNTAYNGTTQYRTTGVPTNNPTPSGITITTNTNATINIRLDWSQYTQGTNKADMIILFWRKDGTTPTVNDSSIAFNVNTTGASYYVFEGVNPADTYSFGIASARKTENGLEIGAIQCPTTTPDWLGVTSGTPNFTGNLNGTSASTVVTNASNGNTANTTVNSNKTTWDRASNINSDGTFNTSKLNGSLTDAQIASATTWNGAKDLLNSWKSGTSLINGGMIATNTIFAQQIAIGDYTNLCQINEEKNPNGHSTTVISNLTYFSGGSGAYANITMLVNTYVDFKVNDEYYIAFNGYRDSGLTSLTAIMRYYYSDSTYTNAGTVSVLPTTSDSRISANLKITTTPTLGKVITSVKLFMEKDGTAGSGSYYVRDIEIRKRYTGELIVDGSITANKITTSDLQAVKIGVGINSPIVLNGVDKNILVMDDANSNANVVLGQYATAKKQITQFMYNNYVFQRNSECDNYDGISSYLNVPRYGIGKFSRALIMEESASTNLVSGATYDKTLCGSLSNREYYYVAGNDLLQYVEANTSSGSFSGYTSTGWEQFYVAVSVTPSTPYTLGFLLKNYNDLGATGMRVQVLSATPTDSNNSANQIAYVDTKTTIDESYTFYSISFTPTVSTVYINLNFGFINDSVQINTKVKDMTLVQGSYITQLGNVTPTPADEVAYIGSANTFSNTTNGTIECWIQPNWSNTDSNGRNRVLFNLFKTTSDGDNWIGYDNTNKRFTVSGAGCNGTATFTGRQTWIHFALAWNSTQLKMYINGSLVSTVTKPAWSFLTTNRFYIGCHIDNDYQFNGLIEDLRVSNVERSATEISNCYTSKQPSLVDANTTLKLDFDNNMYPSENKTGLKIRGGDITVGGRTGGSFIAKSADEEDVVEIGKDGINITNNQFKIGTGYQNGVFGQSETWSNFFQVDPLNSRMLTRGMVMRFEDYAPAETLDVFVSSSNRFGLITGSQGGEGESDEFVIEKIRVDGFVDRVEVRGRYLVDWNAPVSFAGNITIDKAGTNWSKIIFPSQNNDPGYIGHYENNNTSEMRFVVSDDNGSTSDTFKWGTESGGTFTYCASMNTTGQLLVNNGVQIASGEGKGYKFWDSSDNYKISMCSGGVGGRYSETTSDYNMYFNMGGGGTNRGFQFASNGTCFASLTPSGGFRVGGDIWAGGWFASSGYSLSNVSSSGMFTGNGDNATWDTCNMDIQSWWGIGFKGMAGNDFGNGARTFVFNTRNGIGYARSCWNAPTLSCNLIEIGDDARILDCNIVNTAKVRGNQNSLAGYIKFGSGGRIGYNGANGSALDLIHHSDDGQTAPAKVYTDMYYHTSRVGDHYQLQNNANNWVFHRGNGSWDLSITPDWNWTNSISFNTAGNVSCISLTQRSDARLKVNLNPLVGVMQCLENINVYEYTLKSDIELASNKLEVGGTIPSIPKHIGVIAQEVEQYFPDVVKPVSDTDDTKTIDTYALLSVALKAIKELNEEIKILKGRIGV